MDVRDHLKTATSRASRTRAEAHALLEAGFPCPALVWAVRGAEVFMRDFVLAPHFMEEGDDWSTAMQKGSDVLENAGKRGWRKAFAAAEAWWGPFDEPLTGENDHAWEFWKEHVVARRGDIVHGRAVADVDEEEAREVLAFVERMATWYPQRFLTSGKHPLSHEFRKLLAELAAQTGTGEQPPEEA